MTKRAGDPARFCLGTCMHVGYFQFNPIFGEVKRNLDMVVSRLMQVRCELMVLPELFASGYQFASKQEVESLAEEVPNGQTTEKLMEVARLRKMHIVAGLPERAGARFYNSAVVVAPGGFLGVYRKTHLFFEETLWFSAGDTGFQVWDIGHATIGVMICFDWIYPEAARALALKGADILCHPSNLVLPHCPDAMVTRCLENRVFAVTANRVGSEQRHGKERLTYIGKSEIVSPRGHILHRSAADHEDLVILEIDPAESRNKSLNTYNDLFEDRRVHLYHAS
jgi:predicted amidohydrolase